MSSPNLEKEFQEDLDKMKIEAYTGDYYWRARDIQFLLENCTWNKLYRSILKIEKDCIRDGLNVSKDIIRTKTTINDGYGRYTVDDFYLSNIIAYQLFSLYNDKSPKFSKEKFNYLMTRHPGIRTFMLYLFAILTAFFVLMLLTILTVFYLPLKPLQEMRNIYIATAMTTNSHQWLATCFFTRETIDEVMTEYVAPDLVENTIILDGHAKKSKNNIQIFDVSGTGYTGKILKISDPSKVKTVVSATLGKKGQLIENMINENGAVAGINGSGFVDEGGHGSGAYPVGVLISDGEWVFDPYYSEYDIIGLDYSNNLIVGTFSRNDLIELNLRDGVEPFYKLIINGSKRIKSGNGGYGLHPRTAIGQTIDGSILMLVIDGRQIHSIGATMKDCQDILASYGAINAAALDGGSSSIMYYDGEVQTKPSNGTTYGRYLPSAFAVYE